MPGRRWFAQLWRSSQGVLSALQVGAAERIALQYHRLDQLEAAGFEAYDHGAGVRRRPGSVEPAAGAVGADSSVEGDGQMKRVDPLAGVATFLTLCELGSFAATARRLSISPATVSTYIAELETRLQVRLVHRDTRHVTLTPAGDAYRQSLDGLLDQVQRSESIASRFNDAPEGTLKIAAPLGAADWLLRGAIHTVLERYPGICIDLRYSNEMLNLVEHGLDLAVRGAQSVEPNWIARKIRSVRVHVVASPDYVRQRGAPSSPQELAAHSCLHYSALSFGPVWVLQQGGVTEKVPLNPRLACDAGLTLRQWALDGHGLTILPDYFVGADLSAGRLVEVLPDWRPPGFDLHVIYPDNRHITRKVKVFVDALLADTVAERLH